MKSNFSIKAFFPENSAIINETNEVKFFYYLVVQKRLNLDRGEEKSTKKNYSYSYYIIYHCSSLPT
jgi:hypothetical protein